LSTILQAVYPVGSIYTNATNSTNPGTLLGFGTWAAFGAGRVPVGIDSGQTEFDTAEETGGAKTHTLSEAEIPSHYHLSGYGRDATPRYGTTTGLSSVRIDNDGNAFNSTSSAHTSSVGSGNAHNNLQPYIVVYMWKRTA
jgi:microcystin-dependent protein